jgi:hypothetical protein
VRTIQALLARAQQDLRRPDLFEALDPAFSLAAFSGGYPLQAADFARGDTLDEVIEKMSAPARGG